MTDSWRLEDAKETMETLGLTNTRMEENSERQEETKETNGDTQK